MDPFEIVDLPPIAIGVLRDNETKKTHAVRGRKDIESVREDGRNRQKMLREQMKELFQKLCSVIRPPLSKSETTKSILQQTIMYIEHCHETISTQQIQIEQLQNTLNHFSPFISSSSSSPQVLGSELFGSSSDFFLDFPQSTKSTSDSKTKDLLNDLFDKNSQNFQQPSNLTTTSKVTTSKTPEANDPFVLFSDDVPINTSIKPITQSSAPSGNSYPTQTSSSSNSISNALLDFSPFDVGGYSSNNSLPFPSSSNLQMQQQQILPQYYNYSPSPQMQQQYSSSSSSNLQMQPQAHYGYAQPSQQPFLAPLNSNLQNQVPSFAPMKQMPSQVMQQSIVPVAPQSLSNYTSSSSSNKDEISENDVIDAIVNLNLSS